MYFNVCMGLRAGFAGKSCILDLGLVFSGNCRFKLFGLLSCTLGFMVIAGVFALSLPVFGVCTI